MEKNLPLLLKIFDYIAAILYGLLTALFSALAVSPDWPMPLGMVAGTFLGIAAFAVVFIASRKVAGGFELLMSGMIICMSTGMIGGMWITGGNPSAFELSAFSILAGLYVQFHLHMYDNNLHGETEIKD